MQQKHKKKGHSKPIVPVHALLSKPGGCQNHSTHAVKPKGPSSANQQQHQQKQHKAATHVAAPAVLGKRKAADSAQQQPHHKLLQQQLGGAGKQQQQQNGSGRHKQQHHNNGPEKQEQAQKQQQHRPQKQVVQQKQQQQHKKAHQQQSSAAARALQPTPNQRPGKKRKLEQQAANAAAAAAAAATATAKPAKATADSAPQSAAAAAAAAVTAASAAAAAAAAAAAVKPWLPKQPTAVSSNWQQLQQQLKQQQAEQPKRPRKGQGKAAGAAAAAAAKKQIGSTGHNKAATPIVAMDCEMVGVGPAGERDSLARVSIVNAQGNVLLDLFVAQAEPVTDYRTWVSGITPEKLVGAPSLSDVQKQVADLLKGRTIVGHGLKKDLAVLMLSHPRKYIRDTAKYPPFMFNKGGKRRPRALRHLAQQELGVAIQEGQHSSVDDARAALYLYQKHAATWERALKTPDGLKQLPTANRPASKKKRIESYAARDVKDDPMADL